MLTPFLFFFTSDAGCNLKTYLRFYFEVCRHGQYLFLSMSYFVSFRVFAKDIRSAAKYVNEGFKMNALMSIRPEFTDRIISGEKLYEFRKSIFKEDVDRIFIYATAPRREIVGYFTPSKIIADSPEKLWDCCSEVSGISEMDFFKYYENKTEGFAIGIGNLNVFENPIDMSQYPEFHPPQSYLYVENDEFLTSLLGQYL